MPITRRQIVQIAAAVGSGARVLVFDEPTRGVDVGAKAEIHALIAQLAAEGTAILLISSELPELMLLPTRILIIRAGRIVGSVDRAKATEESLLRQMVGLA